MVDDRTVQKALNQVFLGSPGPAPVSRHWLLELLARSEEVIMPGLEEARGRPVAEVETAPKVDEGAQNERILDL